MPKALYFTLPEKKQLRIIEAAFGEFSKVMYHEASINKIIKDAEISRGSFYQYFEDKEDVYFYVIENIMQTVAKSGVFDNVERKPFSIMAANRELLIFNLNLISDERYKSLFENLYLSINQKLQQRFKVIIDKTKESLLKTKFQKKMMDEKNDNRYIKELISILEIINRDLLVKKIANNMDNESILELYDFRIELLSNLNKYMEGEKIQNEQP